MSWRIITSPAGWSEVEKLSEGERAAVSLDLMAWVDDGPPRGTRRGVLGAQLFVDDLPSGFTVTYFVHEADQYAAIVRVRRI